MRMIKKQTEQRTALTPAVCFVCFPLAKAWELFFGYFSSWLWLGGGAAIAAARFPAHWPLEIGT